MNYEKAHQPSGTQAPLFRCAFRNMVRDEYFYLIGLGGLGFLLMFAEILYWIAPVEMQFVTHLDQARFRIISVLFWFSAFIGIFYFSQYRAAARRLRAGVSPTEPELRMTAGMFWRAFAGILLNKTTYIIVGFTGLPFYMLGHLELVYGERAPLPMQILGAALSLIWTVFIFWLLIRRSIKDDRLEEMRRAKQQLRKETRKNEKYHKER